MAEIVLRADALGHRFGVDVPVVDRIDLDLRRGEIVCIVGPSGSGKSTLLRLVTGLMTPTSGHVELEGRRVHGVPPGLGMVFQSYERSLMPWLRVQANVEFPLRGRLSRAARRARAAAALAAVGLGDQADRFPRQLSGGMQQRVAIARALAVKPTLLVMDEPFASVDAQTRADLQDELLALHARLGVTVLVVTHDIDESVYLGDRVVVLTAAPCTIAGTVGVALERPRDQLATKESAEFLAARHRVAELLHGGSRLVSSRG